MDSEENDAAELQLFLENIVGTLSKAGDALLNSDLTRLEILERKLLDQTGVTMAMEAVLAQVIDDGIIHVPATVLSCDI